MCVLELSPSNEAVFKIVQQNQFKASDHLRLRFLRGNDQQIKKYLANKLKTSLNLISELQDKSSTFETSYHKSTETNEQLMYDIQQLREENRRIVDQLKIEEQKKINEVKEKMLVEQSEMQARNDRDKKETVSRLERQALEHQEKIM